MQSDPKLTKNIYLYGPPGSGKTSMGKLLGKLLNMETYDVDDDHLEKVWKTTVSQKLADLGDDGFLEAEGQASMLISKENTIISLTGSNPLHPASMNYIRSQGSVIYLDVHRDEILKRLHKMKVCRIVGQNSKTLSEILDYRQEIYEKYYDVRILIGADETLEAIAEKIIEILNKNQFFKSTRDVNPEKGYTFYEVINKGLASNQGLFLPNYMPSFQINQWERFLDYNFQETALRILESFAISPLKPQKLKEMIQEAYATFTHKQILPIYPLNDSIYLMEEYYGPTASFKDLALQLFSKLFQEANSSNTKTCVLVATSGDTGSAVLSAFNQSNSNTPVIVLYPHGNVSPVQEAQMIVAEGKVAVVGVKADFDFCQGSVKKIFNDIDFQKRIKDEFNVDFTSANSINWGRLFPQIIYSVFGYMELVRAGSIKFNEKVDICLPSGNFGNILGAFFAKSMGLPIDKLICASNENNILTDFLRTGVFSLKERELLNTISPAIDILNPSNLERLLSMLEDNNGAKIKEWYEVDLKEKKEFKIDEKTLQKIENIFYANCCNEKQVQNVIKQEFEQNQILLDPHTAVGKAVADKYLHETKSKTKILLAGTAHFGKFPEAILNALGLDEKGTLKEKFEKLEALKAKYPEFHKELKAVLEKPILHKNVVEADVEKIKIVIWESLKKLIK